MATETRNEVTVSTKPSTEIKESRPSQMFSPLEEVDRLFGRLMPSTWMRPLAWNWPSWSALEEVLDRIPQSDIIDRDKDFLVRVELPGVDKKDVDVSISNSTLNIKGTVSRESKEKKKDYFRSEIAYGNFFRSINLPKDIDATKISAHMKDGVLEVVLPKIESAQRRSVAVE